MHHDPRDRLLVKLELLEVQITGGVWSPNSLCECVYVGVSLSLSLSLIGLSGEEAEGIR